MPTKNQTAKTVRLLRQSSTKMQGFFNVTHFNRIVSKEVSSALQSNKKLGRTPECMIKSGIIAQIRQPRSQRHFALSLQESSTWSKICGFQDDAPTQGSFSNNWNNIDYFGPLENIFLTYQKLIPKKGLFTQFELPYHFLKAIKSGYFPVISDSSYLSLSNKRFKYGTRGYKSPDQPAEFGARLHLCIDGIRNTPINFTPTTGKVHETKIFDIHDKDLTDNYLGWVSRQLNQTMKPLYIIDKGYWDVKRFWNLSDQEKKFIIPKKNKSLTGLQFEFIEQKENLNGIIEARILKPGEMKTLRWILVKNNKFKSNWFSLITNIWDLDAETIVTLYSERWPIEELFKWEKQYTLLKTPLVNSWDGFVLHVLFSILVLLLLQFFISLLGLPRWQENLTEVWRQIRDNPEEEWVLGRLRIPIAFLDGGIDKM